MQDNGVRTQTIKLAEATPHPENYNEHDTAQLARLRGSLAAFGYVRRIVVQEHADGSGYTLVAGHGVAEALEASGYEEVEATVLPSDWSYEKVMAYLVADNELAKLAQSDNEQLARLLQHLEANAPELVEATGFDDERLNELLESIGFGAGNGSQGDAEPQVDRAEELRQKWGTELGQLWQIGEHRLIVGDCTDRAVVERVMGGEGARLVVTDPPYGVSYADKNIFLNAISRANRIETPIENDHQSKEETQAMWKAAFAEMSAIMDRGAVVYCFMPQGGDQMMMMMMMGAGIEPRHELIWLKNNHVLGRVDYAYKHEPILYAWKEAGHKFYGDFQTSILEFPKPQVSSMHPTTKPVELIKRLVSNSSLSGEIVYDPFAGSGTTLVACQNLSRRCRAIEISPAYCAVILQRMSDAFPGIDIRML